MFKANYYHCGLIGLSSASRTQIFILKHGNNLNLCTMILTGKDEKLLLKSMKCFGKDKQIDVAIQELSELIHALSKWKLSGYPDNILQCNVSEELADVEITLHYIHLLTSLRQFNAFKNLKLFRLKQLIKGK